MKIIKMGNLSIATNTCPYCSCEYEYNDADINTGYELTLLYAYVICPCCGQMNRINTLPPNKHYPYTPITFGVDMGNHIPEIEQNIINPIHETWEPDIYHKPDIHENDGPDIDEIEEEKDDKE